MAHRFAGLGKDGRKLYLFEADRTKTILSGAREAFELNEGAGPEGSSTSHASQFSATLPE